MCDVTSTQHEEKSYSLLHPVITILDGKERDIACLVTKVEDLILEDNNMEFTKMDDSILVFAPVYSSKDDKLHV